MLNILCAHHLEAKNLIDGYALADRRLADGQQIYCGDGIRLLVTGQGRSNCDYSLRRLWQQIAAPQADQWMNFGIAGSASVAMGKLVSCDKFNDLAGGSAAYPELQIDPHNNCQLMGLPASSCYSVDAMEQTFESPGVYDMEAYAIASLLNESGSLSRLTVLKLVTDGPDTRHLSTADIQHFLASCQNQVIEIGDNISTV